MKAREKKFSLMWTTTIFGILCFASSAFAQELAQLPRFECSHDQLREEFSEVTQSGALLDVAACADITPCVDPLLRDTWRIDPAPPPTYIRMAFHIVAEDDGSNPTTTHEHVDQHVAQLNSDFAPYGIQFVHTVRTVNASWARVFPAPSYSACDPLKAAFFVDPHLQLNVIVTELTTPGNSWAVNPDYLDPYGFRGGLMMSWVQFDLERHIFTHEVGHAFGLAHPQVGYTHFSCGSPCAENLSTGSTNFNGDQIEDTPPQPSAWGTYFNGYDSCAWKSWPTDSATNHMNFSETAKSEFSPQQGARMRCYIDQHMSQWVLGVLFTANSLFGQAPHETYFSATTDLTVNQWRWSFGDGDSASVSAPAHTYTEPGLYAVQVEVETPEGDFAYRRNDLVGLHADSLHPLDAEGHGGQSAVVEIYARNYLPLKTLSIPLVWGGALSLSLDSATTTGLRSSDLNVVLSSYDPFGKRANYLLMSGQGEALAPGFGPVLQIYYTLGAGITPSSADVSVEQWSSYSPSFSSTFGTYAPSGGSATVRRACCDLAGDADNSGVVNIGDITHVIRRIFNGSAPPACCAEGDADGSGSLSISDVTYVIQYIFSGGSEPICGPVDMGC